MCDEEGVQTLQRGMNYRLGRGYSVVLMSQRSNAPYRDKIYSDGVTIEYEGHDVTKKSYDHNPKLEDQTRVNPSGSLNQNGLFTRAVDFFKNNDVEPEIVKVYEKILPGVWSLKGVFSLLDYKYIESHGRKVFRFIMKLSSDQVLNVESAINNDNQHTRVIPSGIKKVVWKRDGGKCVICGSSKNLHFDHELPYSKGGTSISEKNVRLLCMKHNLEKSSKIE